MILFLLPQRLKQKVKNNAPLKWLINILGFYLLVCIAHFVGFKYTENVNWNESFWQTWQTFTTVGYGNAPAESVIGRGVTVLFGTIGIMFLGAIFSAVFETIQKQKEIRRFGMMDNPFKNSYVIFNYPGRVKLNDFIKETRFVEENVGVCIVDANIEELPPDIVHMGNIHFIKGSTLEQDTYKRAKLTDNKVVIIFPVEANNPESDAGTKTIVDLVLKFVESKKTRIMHVLVNPNNEWMFKDIDSTTIHESMEIFAIVQEAQDPMSVNIIQKLLRNTEGANPKTVVPKKTIGWSWGNFQRVAMAAAVELSMSVNPFALVHNNKSYSCPDPTTIIIKGDFLSIIAYNDFDWCKLEEMMAQIEERRT